MVANLLGAAVSLGRAELPITAGPSLADGLAHLCHDAGTRRGRSGGGVTAGDDSGGGRSKVGDAAESGDGVEAGGCAWPVLSDDVGSGAADDAA